MSGSWTGSRVNNHNFKLPKYLVSGIIRQKAKAMKEKKLRRKRGHLKGFMLIELMIVIVILIVVLIGYLQLFIYCLGLTETTGNSSIAISKAQGKMEEIRNSDFDDIWDEYGEYPENTFILSPDLDGIDGMGVIYIEGVDDPNPEIADLLEVEIFVSWEEKGNRIIGEDSNKNGIIDDGEDLNENNKLDSPVSLVTLIAER